MILAAEEAFQHSDFVQHFVVSAGVAFAALFPIVDPIGNVPFFMSLTNSWNPEERRAEAIKSGIAFFLVISAFMLVGRFILEFFGVSLSALETAGGLVVGYTGWKMINGAHMSPQSAPVTVGGSAPTTERTSIFMSPMAIPQLSGPGAMGMALSLGARHDSTLDYVGFIAGAAGIGLVVVALLVLGHKPISKLGPRGMDALTRVMGLIILTVAVELIFHGIIEHAD